MVKLRPRAEKSHVRLDTLGPSPVLCHRCLCVLQGGGGACFGQRVPREVCSPHAFPSQVLLLCQEGGLKLALNGQGLGATSLGQQALERLRELRVGGGIQLYCVNY